MHDSDYWSAWLCVFQEMFKIYLSLNELGTHIDLDPLFQKIHY